MPTAVPVQGSREIVDSFKDLFPKYLAQWNHGVVLHGLQKGHAQSGHTDECSFFISVPWVRTELFLQLCESQPLGSAGQPKATALLGRFLQMTT